MRVLIPTPLRSYTGGHAEVNAEGASIRALLLDLDAKFPGLRFRMVDEQDRIRTHMRVFVNGEAVMSLDCALGEGDEVQILQALSGG